MTASLARALPAFALALWALLGEQGARVGSELVPPISFAWPLAAVAVSAALSGRRAVSALSARDGAACVLVLASSLPVMWLREASLDPRLSLPATINGESVVVESIQLERRRELRRMTGRRRNVELSTSAVLELPRSGSYRFDAVCDDACELAIGRVDVSAEGAGSATIRLERGHAPLRLSYRQLGGPAELRIAWDTPALVEPFGIDFYLRAPGQSADAAVGRRRQAGVAFGLISLWWLGLALLAVRLGAAASEVRAYLAARPHLPRAAAVLVVLYGCLLRFDALLVHSGRAGDGGRGEALHESIASWVPPFALFNPASAPEDPYRADVRSYLDRAESMTWTPASFYAPSFREPFYVAIVAVFVRAVGGELGILVQSFVFSCATLVLFTWVAARLHGAYWALALLVPISLHEWLVLEAPTGYRMSAYSFFLVALFASLRLPGRARALPHAVLSGALAGLLCLIRLSALSVVAPLAALARCGRAPSERLRWAAAAAVVGAALLTPFLASNLAAHGDPFYSVSFHTEFWLRAEGLDEGQGSVSWLRYFTSFGRFGGLAWGTFLGLTVLPLGTFLRGLAHFPPVGWLVVGAGVLGLAVDVRRGALLAAAYFGHLLPYAHIQNFPSGEMPRFVMPAFFFLVLAAPRGAGWLLTPYRRLANVFAKRGSST